MVSPVFLTQESTLVALSLLSYVAVLQVAKMIQTIQKRERGTGRILRTSVLWGFAIRDLCRHRFRNIQPSRMYDMAQTVDFFSQNRVFCILAGTWVLYGSMITRSIWDRRLWPVFENLQRRLSTQMPITILRMTVWRPLSFWKVVGSSSRPNRNQNSW